MKNEKYKLVSLSASLSQTLLTCIFHFSFFTFHLTSHAAFHAEGSRYGGKHSRQRLENEFPSFLFHFFSKQIRGLIKFCLRREVGKQIRSKLNQ